mmetsp:Transcript_9764/g.18423  ORF Transcript_9764/g.18423 Transcript_9764/m.18423 type:complete len:260 (+) Transcript_9764:801-1580(+)
MRHAATLARNMRGLARRVLCNEVRRRRRGIRVSAGTCRRQRWFVLRRRPGLAARRCSGRVRCPRRDVGRCAFCGRVFGDRGLPSPARARGGGARRLGLLSVFFNLQPLRLAAAAQAYASVGLHLDLDPHVRDRLLHREVQYAAQKADLQRAQGPDRLSLGDEQEPRGDLLRIGVGPQELADARYVGAALVHALQTPVDQLDERVVCVQMVREKPVRGAGPLRCLRPIAVLGGLGCFAGGRGRWHRGRVGGVIRNRDDAR